MATIKIFYSWQTDLPNATNRGLIEKALEEAATAIRNDPAIEVEPVVDRDTVGVPGAPDIFSTILEKIEQAFVFVCDVSLLPAGPDLQPSPNPNVLVELGYAMKVMGPERIIMVMNTAFGGPESLPFDLRMRRVVTYGMPFENVDRVTERRKLAATLELAVRTILSVTAATPVGEVDATPSIGDEATAAIRSNRPDQCALARRFMDWLADSIITSAPDFSQAGERDEMLVAALSRTPGLVLVFARLTEGVAAMNAAEAAHAIYQGFDRILEHYYVPRGFSGSYYETDFDFYKFLGHELFVTLIASLIRQERWELVADLLKEGICVENCSRDEVGFFSSDHLSDYVGLLEWRNNRLKLKRVSVHADLLKQRHDEGDLGTLVPTRAFIEADCFLILRKGFRWRPWSALYVGSSAPRFLTLAIGERQAQRLLRPLNVESIPGLREQVALGIRQLHELFRKGDPFGTLLSDYDPRNIGTQ